MKLIGKILFLMLGVVISLQAVPPVLNYAGQVAVNGQPFEGEGLFKFALVNTDGKITYWSNDGTSINGSEPQASVKVSVRGGLYSLLLGNTAMAGMGAINAQGFSQHSDARLRVWFSDGVNGFQQLSPDRPFASVPYAFSAGKATIADGSIGKSMLGSDLIADLNKSVTITRDMLPQDVRDDLNKTVMITRSMLPADVLADLNRSSATASPITLSMLAPEVTAKLDQNGSGGNSTVVNPPVVGSTLAVPHGSSAPTGYSMYHQVGLPKELVWEEKAPVSVGRWSTDGVEVFNGEIYFLGGKNTSVQKIVERYKPAIDSWETLSPMSIAREGSSCAVLAGKIYAIGGMGLTSVEIYDPATDTWSNGTALPSVTERAYAIVINGLIYLVGGKNGSGQSINQVLSFNPSANQWTTKANMPTSRHGAQLVWFENRIWTIGGSFGSSGSETNKVESYDPATDTWLTESPLITARNWAVAWVANGRIYVGGGLYNSNQLSSIESYNPITKKWSSVGNFPENKYVAGMVVLNNKAYVIGGYSAGGVFSNKVYAADLNASMEGVYDLYRKDGNASPGTPLVQAEVADGSVTASKIAQNSVGIWQLNPIVMKYLKPEITAQPQAQTVYADSNVSYSVTAEGKYLTYQWKKDGSNLTGENNANLYITDANSTLHDGNYSVVVSNDFGSVESGLVEVKVTDSLLNGLVGWWKFDQGSGTVAYDSSGNGNDGSLTGGPTWATGKIGGALSFDGVDDYVEVSSRRWNMENLFSISFWYFNNGTDGTIFSLGNPPYNNEILLWVLSGRQDFYFHKGAGNWARIHEPTLSQGWHHKTTIVNGGCLANQMSSFINGSLYQSTYTVDGIPGLLSDLQNRVLRIGLRVNDDKFFKGLIDDVRIYDRALSAKEVQALYNMGQ